MSGLEGLGIVANVIAVAELSLKVIAWCSKYAQDVKSSHDGRARLLQAAITLHYESDKVRELLSSKKGSKLRVSQRLCSATIGNSETQLRELERQLSQKDNHRSSLKWPLQKEKVEEAIRHIERSTKTMLDMLQVDMADLLVGIDNRAEAEEQRAAIDQLPYVSDAVWDSQTEERNATCLPNTREILLGELKDWIKDTSEQSKAVFWLNGMAGTGKSTISRTISQHLSQNGRLGATFFFKRGEADRGGISKMIPTIARQLAMNQPALSPYIHEAIRNDPTVATKSMVKQFNALVFGPLMKSSGEFSGKSSITIIIDALDECDSETDIRLIVSLFSTTKTIHCPRPRIFITSRPDLPVRLGFQDVRGSYRDLILHDISASIINKDISTFFHHKMKLIREDWNASVGGNRKLPQDWPGSERIQSLIDKAVPLFIFAATACRFINERQLGSPEKQLNRFLQYQTENTTSQLDFTYRPVLAQLFGSNCSKASERRTILEFRRVVGTIINLFDTLSASALSRLLDLDQDIIDSKLDLLHSVLDVPLASDLPIRMLHLSFRDYLMNLDTRENQFWIDEKKSASNLAKDCLRVMETLRPDICLLKIPGTRRSTLKPEFINACIPSEIQYACLYWVSHQGVAGLGPGDATRILKFLKQHLLHWVEAMSLLGRAFQITKFMRELQSAIPTEHTGDMSELIVFIDDAIRFLDVDIQTVNLEPLQIYCSLLALAPSNSIVRQIFTAKVPAWVNLLNGQEADWDPRLHLLGNSDDPPEYSIGFSPDSKLLCFISRGKHLNVWGCHTGECRHDIEPDPEKYFSMTVLDSLGHSHILFSSWRNMVSPDAKSMAVVLLQDEGVAQKILIFNLTTGQVLSEVSESRPFSALAFSLDSNSIWSCTRDGQICAWDVSTGICVERLDCPVKFPQYLDVSFSFEGHKVLIIWNSCSVCVWYLDSSKADETLIIEWPSSKVNEDITMEWPRNMDFRDRRISPDGRLLVTPSSDGLMLVLWDIRRRKLLLELSIELDSVVIMVFSPDSIFLTTVVTNGLIRIWDLRNGKCFKTLVLNSRSTLHSIMFSPDARYLISVQSTIDGQVEVWLWDINADSTALLAIRHASKSKPLLFSPDGKKIVSTTYNGLIQLWDWQGLLQEIKGASLKFQSFSFSPDSTMIAALFPNGDIVIWDIKAGVVLHSFSCPLTSSIAFSPDSSLIATATSRGPIKVWKMRRLDFEWQLRDLYRSMSLDFSPDSQIIATWAADIKIWVRESSTFRFKTLLSSPELGTHQVSFSRDSKLIAASSSGRIKVWNCDTGDLIHTLSFDSLGGPFHVLSIVAQPFSVISSYSMAVVQRERIQVWGLGSETHACILKARQPASTHRASSSGMFIASALNGEMEIWDWSTGETLAICPFSLPDRSLQDFIPTNSIVRTSYGDWALSSSESGRSQLTQLFGVEPNSEWIQWKGHNLFKLPFHLQSDFIEVRAVPGDSLGFTVALRSRSRELVILRFSNEGGMLDDMVPG